MSVSPKIVTRVTKINDLKGILLTYGLVCIAMKSFIHPEMLFPI